MRDWKTVGFIATVVIVLSLPLYLLKSTFFDRQSVDDISKVEYVGGHTCTECHKIEHDLWKESHHYRAMDTASAESVLGDFNNAIFEWKGKENRFYKKDGKFYVHTPGPNGKMGDFQIAYTFGYTPLQQYLIPFEKGRLQCLPIAWNTEKKVWYHLYDSVYQGHDIPSSDWLYWTNNGQNWNGMCADCHSTDLKKGYDPVEHTYQTTWAEINVSCEACHGPGSAHNDWAKLPELARSYEGNLGLVVKTSGIDNRKYVDLCARCHARRGVLGDFKGIHTDLLDYMIPQNIGEPYYFADGQILEEDYVYASFLQSKMYDNEVKCNDCHNVHSGAQIKEGNTLCLQCHKANEYDVFDHHFHKYAEEPGDALVFADTVFRVGEGAQCISCHMPGRFYMGPDFRNDHSLRVPRPDLTISIGTPNACNGCHRNETARWSDNKIKEWYGISRKPHYGSILAAGRETKPEILDDLIVLAIDTLYPLVARAAAINLIASYPNEKSSKALGDLMADNQSIIRHAATSNFFSEEPELFIREMTSMLYDPVKAVRMQAAYNLTSIPVEQLDTIYLKAFQEALGEYREAMEYSGDFAASRHNLGNMYGNLGDSDKAIENYKEAIRIDDQFYPAKINLAMVYNRLGDNNKAEILFRDITKNHPEVSEAFYSFGLLLAEQQKFEEALNYMEKASELMPNRARVFYNMSLLQQYLQSIDDAEKSMKRALALEPDNLDFLFAMTDFYVKTGALENARKYALEIDEKYPQNPLGQNLLNQIRSLQ
ncbi:MAG: tetratricopeptide repeat protein [Bacteroidales bacterium]|nr:tetratricopeptide repeat protein [Bacteroidales bacterium]